MTNLFIKDRVVYDCILVVEVPEPVHDHHHQGGSQEHNHTDAGLRVTTKQKTEHGEYEQEPHADVQIPEIFITQN